MRESPSSLFSGTTKNYLLTCESHFPPFFLFPLSCMFRLRDILLMESVACEALTYIDSPGESFTDW